MHVVISEIITFCVVTLCVRKVITICVETLLHFALKMLLHFALVLHFAAILITFCVNITFCGDYYILRRNMQKVSGLVSVSLFVYILQKMWALLIKSRGGVRGSDFFICPSRVCVAEQGIPVFT